VQFFCVNNSDFPVLLLQGFGFLKTHFRCELQQLNQCIVDPIQTGDNIAEMENGDHLIKRRRSLNFFPSS